jgi:hypothetical protein
VLLDKSHTLRDTSSGNRIDIFSIKQDMPGTGVF